GAAGAGAGGGPAADAADPVEAEEGDDVAIERRADGLEIVLLARRAEVRFEAHVAGAVLVDGARPAAAARGRHAGAEAREVLELRGDGGEPAVEVVLVAAAHPLLRAAVRAAPGEGLARDVAPVLAVGA